MYRTVRRLGACLLLLAALPACGRAPSAGAVPTGTRVREPLTLAPDARTEPPLETPCAEPDAGGASLLISSFYAAGISADRAVCGSSYVELYNPSRAPVSLYGLALYVADRGRAFTEYRFPRGARVPARGHFLICGADLPGRGDPVLTISSSDLRLPFLLRPDRARAALAPAAASLSAGRPLAGTEGLVSGVSADPADGDDRLRFVERLSERRLARRKAPYAGAPFETINLTRAPALLLARVRPRSGEGDVNTEVRSRLDEVTFSADSGFYAEGFRLTLSAPPGYTIYYTVNDTDPRDAEDPSVYTEPLVLTDTTEMLWGRLTTACADLLGDRYAPLSPAFPGAWAVRAYAVRASDGAETPLGTRTYFIGERFPGFGTETLSLTLDSERFLGRDGIYNGVVGHETDPHPHIPAYAEFLSPDGRPVFEGACEVAMNGKGSLGMTQKSFRVLLKSHVMGADGEVENPDTLRYDLFGAYAPVTPEGERVTWFRHLLFRNGGGDMSGSTISRSHIGDAFIQRADRLLHADTMASAPAMVYINGEFFGLFNLRDRLDAAYFEGKYGIPEEDFAMVECPYPLRYGWNVDYTTAYGDPSEAESFMALVRYAEANDLSDPEAYAYLDERIDMESLIDFYCAQIYLCCSDWPSNNIKAWRCTDPDSPVGVKWHFCIADTEHGAGLNSRADTNLWGAVGGASVLGRLMNALQANQAFRRRFLLRYVWCVEVYFTPDRLRAELDGMVRSVLLVMPYQLNRWRVTDGSRTDWDTWYGYIETIRRFIDERPAHAREQFRAWAGMDEATYRAYAEEAVGRWGARVPPQGAT